MPHGVLRARPPAIESVTGKQIPGRPAAARRERRAEALRDARRERRDILIVREDWHIYDRFVCRNAGKSFQQLPSRQAQMIGVTVGLGDHRRIRAVNVENRANAWLFLVEPNMQRGFGRRVRQQRFVKRLNQHVL